MALKKCTSRPKETRSALELRHDTLLAAMSIQEKIGQLYYKTDGNDRLGIPQVTGRDGPHGIGKGASGFSIPLGSLPFGVSRQGTELKEDHINPASIALLRPSG